MHSSFVVGREDNEMVAESYISFTSVLIWCVNSCEKAFFK
jgi:hypothetical protein